VIELLELLFRPLAIQLAADGPEATRVTLSSRADWLGELGSTDRRRAALRDVGYWLRDHAGGVPAG
jgi:hypothetical protein